MITIALQQIPLPPVGFPVTRQQQTQFTNDYATLAAPSLTVIQRKTIRILGLMYNLNNVRGVDYRNNLSQLVADADAYTNGISNFDLEVAMDAIDWSNGNRKDASLTTDVNALMGLHPGLLQRPEQELDRIIAMLNIRLGQ